MYLPKITGNLFWPKFKMAAKMHTNTYIAVPNSARRLILVSRHRFFWVKHSINAISLLVKQTHHDEIQYGRQYGQRLTFFVVS